ncbi:MAG TPA: PAS domain S-box protein, partial [Thermodesulfobacteriota bacterium]|nr:PAS domain S-box protein [Thermodesulfobacteriota bacterium]
MSDLRKTKKELIDELEELREKVQSYENQDLGYNGLFRNNYGFIVESVPSGIVMTDEHGTIIFANKLVNSMLGYDNGDLIGKSIETLVPERYRSMHVRFRAGFMSSPSTRPMGKGRDLFALRKDGSEFPVEIGLNPVHTLNGTVVLSTMIDITERKENERLRLEGEEKLRGIMDNTMDGVIVFDGEGRIETINRAGLVLLAGSESGNIQNIWNLVTPERRDSFSGKLGSARDGVPVTDYE